jgi:hypothetical protein
MRLADKILYEFKYGKVLFGQNYGEYQGLPKERDTPDGKDLVDTIHQYVQTADNAEMVSHLDYMWNELQKLKQRFPKILQPTSNIVYRGTAHHIDDVVADMYQLPYDLKDFMKYFQKRKDGYYQFSFQHEYIHNMNYERISSWTTNIGVAEQFASEYDGDVNEGRISVILCTRVNDKNFIFNPEFLNLIAVQEQHPKEYEVMCNAQSLLCDVIASPEMLQEWWEAILVLKGEEQE